MLFEPPEEMSVLEVSPLVNNGRVDDPHCWEPADAAVVDVPPLKLNGRRRCGRTISRRLGFDEGAGIHRTATMTLPAPIRPSVVCLRWIRADPCRHRRAFETRFGPP